MNTIDSLRGARMHARLTALQHDERGFTLVEMMVAILILGIILTAMASVIITSLTSMQRDEQRVRATQLAQEELERLRAIDWDCAGFDPAGAPYADYAGNETIVYDVADCDDPASAPDATAQIRTVDGIDYTVQPFAYWIDDAADGTAPGDSDPHDYKEFTVDVTWTLRGQTYTHSDSTTRVPTVQEVPLETATVAGFAITSISVSPAAVTLSSGATATAITVVAETSAAATTVELRVPTSGTFGPQSMSDISSGAGTRWQVTIASGSTHFSVGDHEFTVDASGALGSDSVSEVVTFSNAPAVTPVTVNAPLLSRTICAANSNPKATHFSVTVTADIDGISSGDEVSLAWTNDNGGTTMSPVASTASGWRFSGVIPAGTTLKGSSTTLTIRARRISDDTVAQGNFTASIQRQNDSDDC